MVCCDKVRRTVKTAAAAAAAAAAKDNATATVAFALTSIRGQSESAVVTAHCLCCLTESSLAEVLFHYCANCADNKMPALPQGAFAACKIRAQETRRMPVAQVPTNTQQEKTSSTGGAELFPSWKLIDLSPLKYNSKFMNAIWGHYNRYSPHNIKSNDGARQADMFAARQQQRH